MPLVMLVDADPDSSVRLQKALEAAGYEVSVAASGKFALGMLKWGRRRPHMIISRPMFQDMYGSELCSMIRADPATQDIMFILMIDRGSQMGLQTEADLVLPDNAPVDTVVTRIDTHMRLRGLSDLAPPRVSDPQAAAKPGAAAAGPTLQGSLAIMDLTEVTQAVSIGRKSGRLLLSLKAGQGAILFDSGRVVHAEFAGKTGEGAFNALVVASHRERGGSFSFVPLAAGEASQLPKTIQTDLETLLLNIAVEIDERQRDTKS
jgi:DNA-binding response OmpR family regulator